MISKKFFSRSTLLLLVTLLSACAVITPPNTPTPTATSIPTSTPTATPTATPTPKPTTMPTGEPQDEMWMKLKSDGYKVVTSASTAISGKTYFAYLLKRPSRPAASYPASTSPTWGYCKTIFYLWNETEFDVIEGFNIKNARGIDPILYDCNAINWDDSKSYGFGGGFIKPEESVALNLKQYWSDINDNGFPEFTVRYIYDCLDCGYDFLDTRFYEISDNKVIDLTQKISGQILPWNIFYKKDPLIIYAHSKTTYDRIHRWEFEVNWLYQWDGKIFKNVSSQYPDEFRRIVDNRVERIKKSYGKPLMYPPYWGTVNEMTDILDIYNGAELPREDGLKIFLEVTDLSHWLGTNKTGLCWLQASRAYAQIDFEHNKPFRIFIMMPKFDGTYNFPKDIDPRFDTSACK